MNTTAMTYEERRALEQKQAQESREQLEKQAREIATALGGQLYVRPASTMHSNPELIITVTNYNFRISRITYGSDKGKLHISGSYEHGLLDHKPFNAITPSINVSASKTAEVIAKDIKRRFLPDLISLVNEMRQRKAASEAHENQCLNNAKELVALSNGTFRLAENNSGKEIPEITPNHRGFYGSIRVSSTSVRVDLNSLPLAQAKAIVAALGKIEPE